jgi:hypothetical protein
MIEHDLVAAAVEHKSEVAEEGQVVRIGREELLFSPLEKGHLAQPQQGHSLRYEGINYDALVTEVHLPLVPGANLLPPFLA